MPADKLELLSGKIRPDFEDLALDAGKPKGGYESVVELHKTLAILHYNGHYNGIHKLVFRDVAHLGLRHCKRVASEVFRESARVRIYRIDWCVDIPGVPLLDLALYCRLARVQHCSVIRSRSGITFYLRASLTHTVLMYDKLRQLQSIGSPLTANYVIRAPLVRVEVQLRGRGVPIRDFDRIKDYAQLDLLRNLSFWEIGQKANGLSTTDSLAAEGLLRKIEENGLQMTSKEYSSQVWAYLAAKFLRPAPRSKFPDLNELMKKSCKDWLENRVRFPRLPKRG